MKIKNIGALLAILVYVSLGANGQIVDDSVLVDGHYRSFHFLKPASQNASLVFALHGSGGNGLGVRAGAKNWRKYPLLKTCYWYIPTAIKSTGTSAANHPPRSQHHQYR